MKYGVHHAAHWLYWALWVYEVLVFCGSLSSNGPQEGAAGSWRHLNGGSQGALLADGAGGAA